MGRGYFTGGIRAGGIFPSVPHVRPSAPGAGGGGGAATPRPARGAGGSAATRDPRASAAGGAASCGIDGARPTCDIAREVNIPALPDGRDRATGRPGPNGRSVASGIASEIRTLRAYRRVRGGPAGRVHARASAGFAAERAAGTFDVHLTCNLAGSGRSATRSQPASSRHALTAGRSGTRSQPASAAALAAASAAALAAAQAAALAAAQAAASARGRGTRVPLCCSRQPSARLIAARAGALLMETGTAPKRTRGARPPVRPPAEPRPARVSRRPPIPPQRRSRSSGPARGRCRCTRWTRSAS